MRRMMLAAALSLAPVVAMAQPAKKPEAKPFVLPACMVLMPRQVVEQQLNWMAAPDPTIAVRLFALAHACLDDNPVNGVTRHMGPDQCQVVTKAFDELNKPSTKKN